MLKRLAFISPDGISLNARAYVFLALLCVAFFVPGIVTLPPTDRDESLFAQASKQMIESGNYVDIRFQDAPRYKKPIGIYWLQAASVKLFDPHHLDEIWAYRIPSFIGAMLAVLMTAALGALLFGPEAGFLAAIMLASCVILNTEARLAKTDAALLGSIMVAQYAMARAYMASSKAPASTQASPAPCGRGQGWGWFSKRNRTKSTNITWHIPFIFWTALGMGILLKGPIILLIVLSTLLWLRLTEKSLAWFAALKPLIGIPYMLLLIAPWFAAITLASHGQFLQQSAGHDLLGKLLGGEGRGFLPPGSYALAMLITFFPFAPFVLLAAPDSWRNRRKPAIRFCLGWIVPVWFVFELVFVKLPHYVMPVYPALAMLAAKFLLDGFPALTTRRWRWLPPLAIGLWLVTGIALAIAAALLPHILGGTWNVSQIGAGIVLLTAQAASLLFFLRRRKKESVMTMAAGSLIFTIFLFAGTLPNLPNMWISRDALRMAKIINPCPANPPRLVAAAYNEPSLVFLGGTGTMLTNDGKEAAGLMRDDPCRIGVIEDDRRDAFLAAFARTQQKPRQIGVIHGYVMSRAHMRDVALYVMPQEAKIAP